MGRMPVLDKPKAIKTQEEQNDTKLVRFINAVPRFVGDDLNIYGPYEEQDVANLPQKVVKVLIDKNRAEEIK
jgi:DNA replication initiation complex subunit (GINS family)